MIISKKLAIVQLVFLVILQFFAIIWNSVDRFFRQQNESTFVNEYGLVRNASTGYSIFGIIFGLFLIICIVVVFVLGILQIVYAAKRKEGGIYLASGILAIIIITSLPATICNIIGIAKTNKKVNQQDNLENTVNSSSKPTKEKENEKNNN